MAKHTTVDFVVREHLCTSCGACAGACPSDAIEMRLDAFGVFTPVINRGVCTECRLCVLVCPGHGFDYAAQHERIHGGLPAHVALGPCLEAYVGHTTDDALLPISQSGGFVSTLLLFCLEKGLIDGAVVTRWREDAPLSPETFIARSPEEILSAVGSKYNPVPAAQAIAAMRREEGRFAFVGTSCQIQGVRKAEERFPDLAEKIALHIGLHCLGVFTYHFHDQVLHKIGLQRENLARFLHRDKAWRGWPCDMRVEDVQGRVHNLDAKNSRLWPRPFFTNWRCQLCFDKANEFSDVSCGDCRIPSQHRAFEEDGYDLKRGLSEFVVRTERARKIVGQAIEEKRLVVRSTDADTVARSIGVAGKKIGLNTFRRVARIFRVGVPDYGVRFALARPKRSLKCRILSLWNLAYSSQFYLLFTLSRFRAVRWLLKRIPHRAMGSWTRACKKGVEWSRFGSRADLVRESED
jgi:coenzyme F420 hydrogenase subunit beta